VTTPSRHPLTSEQALQKLKHYCAYQERCHQEVKEKLYSYGLHKKEVEELIAQLIEEDYLNEERYAIQYAGGKFRMKQWGRIKIRYALRQHQVSDYCINKALKQINEADYRQALYKLAGQKFETLKGETNSLAVKQKLTGYLLQKGYETNLVRQVTDDTTS
jgi:regulatory protein